MYRLASSVGRADSEGNCLWDIASAVGGKIDGEPKGGSPSEDVVLVSTDHSESENHSLIGQGHNCGEQFGREATNEQSIHPW